MAGMESTLSIIATIISSIALIGVAASLLLQNRQLRASQVQVVREMHLELIRTAIENPEQSGHRISPSGVRNILNATALPDRLAVVDAFVLGCGGTDEDRAAFASAWRRLSMGSTNSTLTDLEQVSSESE